MSPKAELENITLRDLHNSFYILRKPTCSQVFHCDARCAKCFDSCLIKVYVVNLVKLHFTL